MQVSSTNMLTTRCADQPKVLRMATARAQRIGGRIRERREKLGLTQADVAARMGVASVTKDYISRWERGVVEVSEGYLPTLAQALDTTQSDLEVGALIELSDGQPESQLDRIEAKLNQILETLGITSPAEYIDPPIELRRELLGEPPSPSADRDTDGHEDSDRREGGPG